MFLRTVGNCGCSRADLYIGPILKEPKVNSIFLLVNSNFLQTIINIFVYLKCWEHESHASDYHLIKEVKVLSLEVSSDSMCRLSTHTQKKQKIGTSALFNKLNSSLTLLQIHSVVYSFPCSLPSLISLLFLCNFFPGRDFLFKWTIFAVSLNQMLGILKTIKTSSARMKVLFLMQIFISLRFYFSTMLSVSSGLTVSLLKVSEFFTRLKEP